MALLMSHATASVESTSLRRSRVRILLTSYIVLIWFLLVLGGSLSGIFARYPLTFYLAVGGPVVLFAAVAFLSAPFRRFVSALVDDP